MENRVIWKLKEEEKNEIEELFERRIALENLIKCIDSDNNELYEKIIKDYSSVLKKYNAWWSNMSQLYAWEGVDWRINFETSEVILIK